MRNSRKTSRFTMRVRVQAQALLLLFCATANLSFAERSYPELEGPLMGQTPPGMVAEPFAPGIISTDAWELEGVFSPGMEEFYYTTRPEGERRGVIIGFRQTDNIWRKYIELPRRGELVFSEDGTRMHMAKGYRDRVADGWSELQSIGPLFDNKDFGIMRLSPSASGTYVFDDYLTDVIRISRVIDGDRQAPVPMGEVVNSGKWTAHPYIAPDESYLIWDSEREGGFGESDLYISFRQQDGSWGPATNMGEAVNSPRWDAFATVTPDGKYMLFQRGMDEENENVDIYWVDARIIEELKGQQ